MAGPCEETEPARWRLGARPVLLAEGGGRPGIPETGAGRGEAPGPRLCRAWPAAVGLQVFSDWSSWEQVGGGGPQCVPGEGGRAAEGFRRDRGNAGMLSRQWGPWPRPTHLPR